jgi:3-oxoacyl-(acyl-carrier-protein) synthase
VVTGAGLVCGAGGSPAEVLDAVRAGRSAIAPIRAWDASGWPAAVAAEIPDYDPVALGGDRKLVKMIRRTDVLGLAAASQAVAAAGLAATRAALAADAATDFDDRSTSAVAAAPTPTSTTSSPSWRAVGSTWSAATSAARSTRCGSCGPSRTTCFATPASGTD